MALSAAELAAVSRLLDEALELDAMQREHWLQTLPGQHEKLAPVLREMLAHADTNKGSLLDRAPQLNARLDPEGRIKARQPGERVGPYELTRRLGAGGMAEVWLARRADGAYKRDLALKLPMLARLRKDLERRFALERDILASLEHPNIARLYDAGVSPDGVPYLAMEYVHGRPITLWCDGRRIGLRERLQLFRQMIEAVQYAHARQIIHRDLKPSNILVAESGEVRLLDFGVASLLEAEEDETDRIPVHLYARALTPDYASPELLRGEPVDAASDVYSLGAVLYELLAGDRPYRLKLGLSVAQLEHAIASAPLDRPSARVAPGAGAARATTQDRLEGRLRGELDAITLKALAWRPVDRYQSAAALAADLERYLRGEAVEAMPKPNRLTTEDVIAQLSRNPKVRIRARAGEAAAENRSKDTQPTGGISAANRRDGAYVLSGKTLRISAQLLRTVDATQLWAQSYRLGLSDGLALEHNIAAMVVRAVNAALEAGVTSSETAHPNSDAYRSFLLGNFFGQRCTRADIATAIGFYQEATRMDPDLAAAWAKLAIAQMTCAVHGWTGTEEALARAQRAIERALSIDASLACAYEARGVLDERFHWNWARARADFERARELDTNDDQASIRLAWLDATVFGRFDAAIVVFDQVLACNPAETAALSAAGWVHGAAGRTKESAAAYQQLLTLNPSYHGVHASLALALGSMGQHAEALAAIERESDDMTRRHLLPIVAWIVGRQSQSDALLQTLQSESMPAAAYQIAAIHAWRSESDAAFEWLERAYRLRDPNMTLLRSDPRLHSLRGDARLDALLVRMNLAA